jgi:SAM-dependent methyltransferase
MTNDRSGNTQIFDQYAQKYDEALNQSISISGEEKDYFAHGRIRFLSSLLNERRASIKTVLDFGCGTGSATPHVMEILRPDSLLGLDTSPLSLQEATTKHSNKATRFLTLEQYSPNQEIDLAYCSAVFHHIPPDDRAESVEYVYRSLKVGGYFSFWEHNLWNPGARYVMSRCPFDEDAIPLRASESRRLLAASGFKILRTDYLFIFPRFLRYFRGIERKLTQLPLGAQYQVLCIK